MFLYLWLLQLFLAAWCGECSNLRATPQSVKQHKAAKLSSTKRTAYQTGYETLQAEMRKAALSHAQQQQQQQQREHQQPQQGSWVGIASVQAAEPTKAAEPTVTPRQKPEAVKHKHKHQPKPHRHNRQHSQVQNDDRHVDHEHELFEQQQDKAFAEQLKLTAAPRVGRSLVIGEGLSQPPLVITEPLPIKKGIAPAPAEPQTDSRRQQQQTRSSDSFWDNMSSSSSSRSDSDAGNVGDSSSSSGSSLVEGPASIGSITQFSRVLKISYEGAAGDSGVAPDASVAGGWDKRLEALICQ
jgi:hypothetical protein